MEATTHPKMLPVLILIMAITVAAVALMTVPSVEGATIVVPDDYTTIQDAIDNANASDTIRVHAGNYSENLVINTQVEIIGNGTTETVIQTSSPTAVDINADGTNLSKIKIDGGGTSGVYIKGENCTIEDINVTGSSRGLRTNGAHWLYIGNSTFTGNSDFGMIIHLSNNVTIYGCEVTNNAFDDGIQINSGQSDITISHTLVDSNGFMGIEFLGNSDIRVDNCTITNNFDTGIWIELSQGIDIHDNDVDSNFLFAIYIFFSSDIMMSGNNVTKNIFGTYIDNCAKGEIWDNVFKDNEGVGIGLFDSGGPTPLWVHHNLIQANALVFQGLESGLFIGGFSTADGNIAEDNQIIGNHKGIVMRYGGAHDNIIRRNIIRDNGMGVENNNGAGRNIYYHNSFINNTIHLRYPSSVDSYDSGYPNGGNYWDTYSGNDVYSGPSQDVRGPDSLGDTPMRLSTSVSDGYPLLRAYGDNPLAAIAIVHPDDGIMVAGTIVAEAVVTGDIVSVVEWHLDGTLVGADTTEPYQYVLDTTSLTDDMAILLKATAHVRLSSAISDSISITVNNMASVGPNITVATVSPDYAPDDRVTAVVTVQGVSTYSTGDITAFYMDAMGTVIHLPMITTTQLATHGFTFWLPSDIGVGNVTLQVSVRAYQGTSHIWTSSNSTTFAVIGLSQSDQLEAIVAQLTQIVEDIDGLNMTNVAERAAALADILDRLGGLDAGIQARMNALEGTIADNTSALQEYIGLQTDQITLLMDDLNTSMADQMAAIDQAISDFRDEAGMGMVGIAVYLDEMEANGSVRHGEVMQALEALNETTLDDLRSRLVDLSDDLTALDDAEAQRHADTVAAMVLQLDALNEDVTDGFNATDSQLAALAQLDIILEQLNALSDDVADIKDSTEGGGSSTVNLGLIVAFGIITILLLFVLMSRIKDMGNAPPPPPAREPEPVVVPSREVVESPEETESFELMLEEPEMYPDTDGPIMMTPEEPPEAPPEAPMGSTPEVPADVVPEVPQEEPSVEPPELIYDAPEEVTPPPSTYEPEVSIEPDPEIHEVPPPPAYEPEVAIEPDPEIHEVPPPPPYEPESPIEPDPEVHEVPPPPVSEIPEAPPYEPYEVPSEVPEPEPELEPVPESDFEAVPEPVVEPEPEVEPVPEPELEQITESELEPIPEPEVEPEIATEVEPVLEEEPLSEMTEAEVQGEEGPPERKKTAQEWVIEEIMEEIDEPHD
jgi:parallel beta-helix repeat protein